MKTHLQNYNIVIFTSKIKMHYNNQYQPPYSQFLHQEQHVQPHQPQFQQHPQYQQQQQPNLHQLHQPLFQQQPQYQQQPNFHQLHQAQFQQQLQYQPLQQSQFQQLPQPQCQPEYQYQISSYNNNPIKQATSLTTAVPDSNTSLSLAPSQKDNNTDATLEVDLSDDIRTNALKLHKPKYSHPKLQLNQQFESISEFQEISEEIWAKNNEIMIKYKSEYTDASKSKIKLIHYKCTHHKQIECNQENKPAEKQVHDLVKSANLNKRKKSCKGVNCPAEIRIAYIKKNNLCKYQITSLKFEHNHELNKSDFESNIKHRKLNPEQKEEAITLIKAHVNVNFFILFNYYKFLVLKLMLTLLFILA